MNRRVGMYGVLLGVLVLVLKMLEYKWLIRDISWELSVLVVALVFMLIGFWLSQRLTRPVADTGFQRNQAAIAALALSARELAVLEKLAEGLSNQQIAEALFVSVNTIKTHLKNGFAKLEVNSRTQAVNKLKALHIVP